MANIDEFKSIYNNDQQGNKNCATKVLIITSVNDDDKEKIFSYLAPTNGETVFVDLNNKNMIDISSNNNNKRLLLQVV